MASKPTPKLRELYHCDMCSQSFNSEKDMIVHKNTHCFEEKPYECFICSRRYKTEGSLQGHICAAHMKKQYQCEMCSKSFGLKSSLKLHVRSHTSIHKKPFRCEICTSAFAHERSLIVHMRTHTSGKMYECKKCNLSYSEFKEYRKHKLSHEKRQYTCNECGKLCSSKSGYGNHIKIHEKKKVQLQIGIQQVFTNWIDIRKDEKRREKEKNCHITKYIAIRKQEICKEKKDNPLEKGILSFAKWMDNPKQEISQSTNQFSCKLCGLSYSKELIFHANLGKDHTETIIHCDICQKTLDKKAHIGDKFVCKVCGKTHNNRKSYLYHVQKHPNVKPYKCRICNKSFASGSELRSHKQSHSTHPYACRFCNRSFATKSAYWHHQRIHRLLRSCVDCKKWFDCSTLLQNLGPVRKNYKCPTCIKTGDTVEMTFEVDRNSSAEFTSQQGPKEPTTQPAELCSQTCIKKEEILFEEKVNKEQSHQPVGLPPEIKVKEEAFQMELNLEIEHESLPNQIAEISPETDIKVAFQTELNLEDEHKRLTNQTAEISPETEIKEEAFQTELNLEDKCLTNQITEIHIQKYQFLSQNNKNCTTQQSDCSLEIRVKEEEEEMYLGI